MSTPRIGPPGSPGVPAETHEAEGPAQATQQRAVATATATDHVEQRVAKGADPRPQQATTLAFTPPHQPERREFLGGDRGAWLQGVRENVLKLAENREAGRMLLEAFNRGFA